MQLNGPINADKWRYVQLRIIIGQVVFGVQMRESITADYMCFDLRARNYSDNSRMHVLGYKAVNHTLWLGM